MEKITPPSDAVASPCVRNCCLNEQDICLGCYRSITEITGWSAADNYQRNEILLRCSRRRLQQGHKVNLDTSR